MVPSRFVYLNSFPSTNGKLDRRAFPCPSEHRPALDTPFVAPTTTVEKRLARIWSEVLSLEKVGIHDNFLELGGHSLAATQVLSRVINAFMVEVPLKSLFDAPTVEKMAAVINEHQHRKLGEQDLNRILGELESMSDEDAQRLLARESTPRT